MKKRALGLLSLIFSIFLISGCGGGEAVVGTSPSPQGLLQASGFSAGDFHTCATLSDGRVKCWGLNSSGQLGDGTTFDSFKPVFVSGVSAAREVSAGGGHTCVLLSNGSIQCWGSNASGQLGNSTTTSSATPVSVKITAAAISVSSGGNHTCAVISGGAVRCWGSNSFGQLGNGTTSSSSIPVEVSGITNATAVSAGGRHTCARLSDGTVKCWGSNALGQLGNTAVFSSPNPISTTGVAQALEISAGANHTCASLSNGSVQCWGDNSLGQLGNQWTIISTVPLVVLTNSFTPLFVSSITNASGSIGAGLSHTCARISDATIKCWGDNSNGQLGTGSNIGFVPPGSGVPNSTLVPVTVSVISNATKVDAGLFHSCALLSSNRIMCWGLNSNGQLGNGTNVSFTTPVEVVD